MSLVLETAWLDDYLARVLGQPVTMLAFRALGGEVASDPKGFGYGVPFEVECLVGGERRCFVVSRTRPAQGFGHDYPAAWPALPPETCEALECALVRWRWRLRDRTHRLSRTHGDFHPWNILFRAGTDFSVLDRSRGEWGEPADDIAALGINYLFFGMRKAAAHGERGVAEPFRSLFHSFLSTYVAASRDYDLFETLPPFLAFRSLVLAHPRWHPALSPALRTDLGHLAAALAGATRFDPSEIAWLCGAVR